MEDNRPLAQRRLQRARNPPGQWWIVKKPVRKPSESDNEADEEEEENVVEDAQVVISGITPNPTSYREAVNGENSAQWQEAMLEEQN